MKSKMILLAFGLAALAAHGQEQRLEVVPKSSGSLNNMVFDAPNTMGVAGFTIRAHFSCFGTNLRNVSNPLSPSSTLLMNINFPKSSSHSSVISFPAAVTKAGGLSGSQHVSVVSGPSGVKAVASGNTIQITFPSYPYSSAPTRAADEDLEMAGKQIDRTQLANMVKISFVQKGAPGGAYMGHDGPIQAKARQSLSKDMMVLDFHGAFPGQAGFCGGYYSPIMLFFDDKRPKFSQATDFPMNPSQLKSYWPEAGAPGYFLALDKNKDGKINDGTELFGSRPDQKNGFEDLKSLDGNKDGVLDSKDKLFSALKLWQDRNGNGKTEKGELIPLKNKNIVSISLKYEVFVENYGGRAEARERSQFTYKDDKGKMKTGDVIDIWFTAAP